MRASTRFTLLAAAALVLAAPAFASRESADLKPDAFYMMCDADKDGMVSKAELMKAVEKAFDKQDKKKAGKLDKKQTEAFLKELMKGGG
jgi:hypothetical protein